MLIVLVGCSSTINRIDTAKLEKAAKLADQIEMNNYKLIATNNTIILISPK